MFFSGREGHSFDVSLLDLSKQFVSKTDIRDLAIKGLLMPLSKVESHINNNLTDINSAAYDILRNWRTTQSNDEMARKNLTEALKKVNKLFMIQSIE